MAMFQTWEHQDNKRICKATLWQSREVYKYSLLLRCPLVPPHSSYDYVLFFPNQLLFPTLFGLKLYIWLFHIWRQRIRQYLFRLKCSCPHRIFVMISEYLFSSTFSSVPTAKHILLFKKKYKNLEEPLSKLPIILTLYAKNSKSENV